MFEKFKNILERKQELIPKVGDRFINPVTEQPTKITFLGDKVFRFYLKTNRNLALFYEAIEGSEQFNNLKNDPRFENELVKTEPSVELEWITDIENRRIVVPLKDMDKFKYSNENKS